MKYFHKGVYSMPLPTINNCPKKYLETTQTWIQTILDRDIDVLNVDFKTRTSHKYPLNVTVTITHPFIEEAQRFNATVAINPQSPDLDELFNDLFGKFMMWIEPFHLPEHLDLEGHPVSIHWNPDGLRENVPTDEEKRKEDLNFRASADIACWQLLLRYPSQGWDYQQSSWIVLSGNTPMLIADPDDATQFADQFVVAGRIETDPEMVINHVRQAQKHGIENSFCTRAEALFQQFISENSAQLPLWQKAILTRRETDKQAGGFFPEVLPIFHSSGLDYDTEDDKIGVLGAALSDLFLEDPEVFFTLCQDLRKAVPPEDIVF